MEQVEGYNYKLDSLNKVDENFGHIAFTFYYSERNYFNMVITKNLNGFKLLKSCDIEDEEKRNTIDNYLFNKAKELFEESEVTFK